jgi:hypothetical protein
MDGQVLAAVIGGVCTLAGVAAGAAGTFAAAKAQISGAREQADATRAQADATLEQAHSTYRAALDQSRSTERAMHEQWRRTQRREAYAGFISAMDQVEEVCARPAHATTDGLDGASRALSAARSMVELEGSERLTRLAAEALEACTELGRLAAKMAPHESARRMLEEEIAEGAAAERADPESRAGRALEAHSALTMYRDVAFHYEKGGRSTSDYEEARARAEAAVEAYGQFTRSQIRALMADATWASAFRASSAHAKASERLAAVRSKFVEAARGDLELGAL